MRKHGYYTRYYVGCGYSGKILVRRYICKDCGKTVSMLPSFRHQRFQYDPEIIFLSMSLIYRQGMAMEAIAVEI